MSGYTLCPCCGDDTVSSDMAEPELCELCEEAGCDPDSGCDRTYHEEDENEAEHEHDY